MPLDKIAINLIGNPKGMLWYQEYLKAKAKELDAEIARLKEELKKKDG